MKQYDSREDTQQHILKVRGYIADVRLVLVYKAKEHDRSKLKPPEKEVFDEYTPKLKAMTYGSAEYKAALEGMKQGLRHHYDCNLHHPEHFLTGTFEMTLMDIIEMLCDWKAASERHDDGNIYTSLEVNQDRFGYSDELKQILANTAGWLGW